MLLINLFRMLMMQAMHALRMTLSIQESVMGLLLAMIVFIRLQILLGRMLFS